MRLGATVTASDLAPSLVEAAGRRLGCRAEVADALELAAQFGAESFDFVLSSECIEHTPDPDEAVRQMCRVLKPGGFLSLSTPNVVWYPVVALASKLHLRPFDGIENFNTFGRLRKVLESEGLQVVEQRGLHLFPFQFGLHGLSRLCDRRLQVLRSLMINLCVLACKPGSGSPGC
jgi:2-polyprenyl-3-methyl-5-hydroxy-6-metoxy-1,4-benzoquinol methylase